MRQKLTLIIASLCIVVYVAAVGFAAYSIYTSIKERLDTSEREFFDLVDLVSAAGVLGFMDEPFKEAVRDGVMNSRTLQGAIISGPYGNEYTVERRAGIITWFGDTPRFESRFGLAREPFHSPLRIDGIRNVTISAISDNIDYDRFMGILKNTLLAVLGALALAFLTLIVELVLIRNTAPVTDDIPARRSRRRAGAGVTGPGGETPSTEKPVPAFSGDEDLFDIPGLEEQPARPGDVSDFSPAAPASASPGGAPARQQGVPADGGDSVTAEQSSGDFRPEVRGEKKECSGPQGLYSPHGHISWEAYTRERLASELHRCASFEQDLVFIVMEFRDMDKPGDGFFNEFTEAAVAYFTLRDLIFEWGNRGISVIIPNIDLDQGFAKGEEFLSRIRSRVFASGAPDSELCMGLSSRAGRLIDAERLIFEAARALDKALEDPVSPIVAFKSDPEKYRAFIASQMK